MKDKISHPLNIRKKKQMLILASIFAVLGVGKIWLWATGMGNDFGLYLGVGFCVVSIINFRASRTF